MSKPTQTPRISAVVGELAKRAPLDLAESWDNVGFLAGDADAEVTGIVVAVNLGREALDEAKARGANLIVCHHPPIFKPVSKLTKASSPYLYEAVRNGFGVMALHTNFDLSSEKLNRDLAEKFGCSYIEPVAPRGGVYLPKSMSIGKFITMVPETHLDAVREAVSKAGGGVIGDYTECSFSWPGEGTFRGGESTNPAVGQKGKLEKAAERRLEMVFPWKSVDKIVAAARKAHPYEEMAYDVVKLANALRDFGYGFVGDFPQKMGFEQVLAGVKHLFRLQSVTVVNSPNNQLVKRIAFSPGSGSSFVNAAIAKGVDAYICGEVGYHHMLDAKRDGMGLIVLGHSNSERFYVETVAEWCSSLVGADRVSKVFEVVDTHA